MKTGLKTDFRHIQWYALFSVLKIVDNSTFEFWANMTDFLSCFWMGWRDDDSIFRVGWVKTTVKVSLSLNFVSLKSIKTSLHQFANLQFCHKKWLINIYFISRKYSWVKKYDKSWKIMKIEIFAERCSFCFIMNSSAFHIKFDSLSKNYSLLQNIFPCHIQYSCPWSSLV